MSMQGKKNVCVLIQEKIERKRDLCCRRIWFWNNFVFEFFCLLQKTICTSKRVHGRREKEKEKEEKKGKMLKETEKERDRERERERGRERERERDMQRETGEMLMCVNFCVDFRHGCVPLIWGGFG